MFLTIVKVRAAVPPDMRTIGETAWAFPLVGAVIGILLVIADALLQGFLPDPLRGIVVVGVWIVITGALHIDGWTDCWDALPTALPQERRYEILKDSRLGTFGAVGLIFLLAVKFSAIGADRLSPWMLFAAPVLGRGLIVLCFAGAKSAEPGMARSFLGGINAGSRTTVGITVIIAALLAGLHGVVALIAAYLAVVWFKNLAESRLGGVNGDVMGGGCELAEAVVLIIGCAWTAS